MTCLILKQNRCQRELEPLMEVGFQLVHKVHNISENGEFYNYTIM